MSVINNLLQKLFNRFAGYDWVVRDNISHKDIEICGGAATEDLASRTCAICVAVNRTAYKPNAVCTYEHAHCKCVYDNTHLSAHVDFPISKITEYLFVDVNKAKMMRSMGYSKEDSTALHKTLSAVIKKQYEDGNYELGTLDIHGQRVQINTVLLGKRDHKGEMFDCHIGCVLWPYGKIKVTTPLIKEK